MISPQTIDKSIFDAMFSNVRKTSSIFKIESWKRDAEKIRSIDIYKYRSILGTIAAYENKYDEAINIFQSIFELDKKITCLSYRKVYDKLRNEEGKTIMKGKDGKESFMKKITLIVIKRN